MFAQPICPVSSDLSLAFSKSVANMEALFFHPTSSLLQNLDALHDHLATIYPGMRAPSFRCTDAQPPTLLPACSTYNAYEIIG